MPSAPVGLHEPAAEGVGRGSAQLHHDRRLRGGVVDATFTAMITPTFTPAPWSSIAYRCGVATDRRIITAAEMAEMTPQRS